MSNHLHTTCDSSMQRLLVTRCRCRFRHPCKRDMRRIAQCAMSSTGLRAVPWTGSKKEQEALATLRNKLKSCKYGVPDDETLIWYLRDRYFDPVEAESKLLSMLQWRQSFRPTEVTFQQVQKEFSTGKGYVHEHPDKHGRPVIIVRANKHMIGRFPLTDSKRLAVYLLEEAFKKLPAAEEQVIGIFDLRGFGVPNADIEFAKFMVDAFFEYYPRRVAQVYFVEAPWVFQSFYTVIQPLLRKYSALVKFSSAQEVASQLFTPSTVPVDYQ